MTISDASTARSALLLVSTSRSSALTQSPMDSVYKNVESLQALFAATNKHARLRG
jgi:hypothetical protein